MNQKDLELLKKEIIKINKMKPTLVRKNGLKRKVYNQIISPSDDCSQIVKDLADISFWERKSNNNCMKCN